MPKSYIEVIWDPKKSRAVDSSYPELNCPVRFVALSEPATDKKGRAFQEIEPKSVFLVHGSNKVDADLWSLVRDQEVVKRFIDATAITVIEPRKDIAELTGTSLDFNASEARAIINESLDVEWLKTCIMTETANADKRKPGETDSIRKACENRIRAIESSERKMAAASLNKGLEEANS